MVATTEREHLRDIWYALLKAKDTTEKEQLTDKWFAQVVRVAEEGHASWAVSTIADFIQKISPKGETVGQNTPDSMTAIYAKVADLALTQKGISPQGVSFWDDDYAPKWIDPVNSAFFPKDDHGKQAIEPNHWLRTKASHAASMRWDVM